MAQQLWGTRCQDMSSSKLRPHNGWQVLSQQATSTIVSKARLVRHAAPLGQSAPAEEPHAYDQQNHQQQRSPALAPPPVRKQLVRPAYCVATEVPASTDAADSAANGQNGNGTALHDSIQQSGTAVALEQTELGNAVAAYLEAQDNNSSSDIVTSIRITTVATLEELKSVAQLRAEAYYADDNSRFAQSFKRQFAAQEVESLRQRTAAATSSGRAQLCECLIATTSSSSSSSSAEVLGCIDIRLPQTVTGMRCIGVPDGDGSGCYLLNVVVSEAYRGQGIGKQLMKAAMSRAVHHWGSLRLYTHVQADNEVASGLYRSCGFQEHSSEERYADASTLGRLVLLMATVEDAPELGDTLYSMQEQSEVMS